MSDSDNGITKGAPRGGAMGYLITVFLGIAMYNVIELTFIIWVTFRRYSGLYFCSFQVATYGILLYSLGFLIKTRFPDWGLYFYITLIATGWVCMVTGQSMVLYSRLHLILHDRRRLRLVLWMIIINAVICHVPIIVVLYGANSNDSPERFVGVYTVYEKVQVTIFFIQESIISGLYIAETVKLMRLERGVGRRKASRRLMKHLIVVNSIIIVLDMTILGLEYGGLYGTQTAYKALVYSAKLKLEFSILNRLVEMTTGNRDAGSSGPKSTTGSGTQPISGMALASFNSEAGAKYSRYQAFAQGGEEAAPPASSSGQQVGPPNSTEPMSEDGVVLTREVIVKSQDRAEVEDTAIPVAPDLIHAGGPTSSGSGQASLSLRTSPSDADMALREGSGSQLASYL